MLVHRALGVILAKCYFEVTQSMNSMKKARKCQAFCIHAEIVNYLKLIAVDWIIARYENVQVAV